MKTKILIPTFMFLLVFSLVVNFVQATASVTISQSGADEGTVMKGIPFTVTVSGLSGSGTVTLVLPSGFSTSEELTKSFSEGTSSVSWTTVVANNKVSGTTISATVSTPDTGTSDSFDVVLPPSLSASVSPSSVSVTQGSSFAISLNIQNSGETTAHFGSISISPSDFSISSGCSPSSISGGQSSGILCTISVSSSAITGSRTVTLTITPSNADAITKNISVTVSTVSSGGQPPSEPSEEKPGGGELPRTRVNVTRGKASINIPSIAAGKMANVTINKTEDVAFRSIEITVTNSVNNIIITITKLAGQPADIVHEVSGKVYHYIEIKKTNINDTQINKTKVRFTVNKSWINSNNINESTIVLNRYSNNKWNPLPTTKVGEDPEEIYFESEFTGLSIFAISGQEKITVAPPTCPTCPQATLWSDCVDGKQTRTNYKCDETTNFECQSYTEEQTCALIEEKPTQRNWIYIIIAIVIIGFVAYTFLIKKRKVTQDINKDETK
ncbi:MAG: PGF-pre-PGF domain-containing protein [Candidatus Aenigmatarchaeota archaeon]